MAISVPAYSKAEDNQALSELNSLPAGSILPRFIRDYAQMRRAVRAAQE